MLDFGGFTLDLDVKCFKPLDVFRCMASSIQTHTTYENMFLYNYRHSPVNFPPVFASRPDHPLFKKLLDLNTLTMFKNYCGHDVLFCTGPYYMRSVYQKYIQDNLYDLQEEDDILMIHPR